MPPNLIFSAASKQTAHRKHAEDPLGSAVTGGAGSLRARRASRRLDENASELDALHWRITVSKLLILLYSIFPKSQRTIRPQGIDWLADER